MASSGVVTHTELCNALRACDLAHRAADWPEFSAAARLYASLLITARTHVLLAHLAGTTIGVAWGRGRHLW